ncbi:hypothetical protein LPU83_pLPU83d_0538 (plasmid) [Rhizobium favelukesii]|uniref:Uncharacterized protein n=1 Tax=Rhizobium favelukesii TaxID=348824 RepID=W6RMA7_9HYPH|nr:hypothetical protein LPU83_pLPU83d_0538 [Rhizobium favelukesii]
MKEPLDVNLVGLSSLRRICIYLPDTQTINLLETALTAEGLAAATVTSLAQFETTISRGHYTAIITISSCIDGIREFSDLMAADVAGELPDREHASDPSHCNPRRSGGNHLLPCRTTCGLHQRRDREYSRWSRNLSVEAKAPETQSGSDHLCKILSFKRSSGSFFRRRRPPRAPKESSSS